MKKPLNFFWQIEMYKSYELIFSTSRGEFRLSVCKVKSRDERISFKTGYNGQPLKYIKVTTRDPSIQKVTSRKDIDHIVQADEIQSLYPTGEDDENGNPEYVVVDKTSLKNMFPSNQEMRVLRTVPLSCVPFHYIEGSHYFLNVKKIKKGKNRITNPEDEIMYDMLHFGLMERQEAFLVRYTESNTNKYAIVYATECGLRLSVLLASNYQRQRQDEQVVGEQKSKMKLYDRLVGDSRKDRIKVKDINDVYEEKLQEMVQVVMDGKVFNPVVPRKTVAFSRLSALEDDTDEEENSTDEEEPLPRSRTKSKSKSKSRSSDSE